MIGIELFDFQEDTISYLLDKTTDIRSKRKIIIKSCTGERVIIVMGAINVLKSRVSGTFTEKFLCIAYSN